MQHLEWGVCLPRLGAEPRLHHGSPRPSSKPESPRPNSPAAPQQPDSPQPPEPTVTPVSVAAQDPPATPWPLPQEPPALRCRGVPGSPRAAITPRRERPKSWCQGVDSLPSPLTGAFRAKDDAIGLREIYRAGFTTAGRMLEQPV